MSDDEIRARLEEAASLCDRAAEELDGAAAHARVAAQHFRNREVPRAGAHLWATLGHLVEAQDRLHEQAREHRLRARVPPEFQQRPGGAG